MAAMNRLVLAAHLLALVLSGCANGRAEPVTPRLGGEAACYVSIDPAKCKLARDKAGGHPFRVQGSVR